MIGTTVLVHVGKFLIFVDDELEKKKREKGKKRRAKRAMSTRRQEEEEKGKGPNRVITHVRTSYNII